MFKVGERGKKKKKMGKKLKDKKGRNGKEKKKKMERGRIEPPSRIDLAHRSRSRVRCLTPHLL